MLMMASLICLIGAVDQSNQVLLNELKKVVADLDQQLSQKEKTAIRCNKIERNSVPLYSIANSIILKRHSGYLDELKKIGIDDVDEAGVIAARYYTAILQKKHIALNKWIATAKENQEYKLKSIQQPQK